MNKKGKVILYTVIGALVLLFFLFCGRTVIAFDHEPSTNNKHWEGTG